MSLATLSSNQLNLQELFSMCKIDSLTLSSIRDALIDSSSICNRRVTVGVTLWTGPVTYGPEGKHDLKQNVTLIFTTNF